MKKDKEFSNLLEKVEKVTQQKKLDLSSSEDLSIGIMNLISIEEHLFFTSQKTGKEKYLDLLNEIRSLRTDLLKEIVKDYEGEVWCISKHLLAASMRLIEVGTKKLKKGRKRQAQDLFDKAYKLYSLFWGINLKVVKVDQVEQVGQEKKEIRFTDEKSQQKGKASVFDKLGELVKKAINCCKE
ncbi:MAG: hypothetical protein ACC618_03490 [Patescibacteria group bacterium]